VFVYNKQFIIQYTPYEHKSEKNQFIYFHSFILHSSNMNTINTNTEALLADRKEVGLEVNAERNGRVFFPWRECRTES
jgi:hypothetical protein